MKNKRCLLFDLDYTLIENTFYPWIYEAILSSLGDVKLDVDGLRKVFFKNFRSWLREGRYVEAFDWDKLLDYTLSKLGYEAKINFTDAFVDNFVSGRAKLIEGVKDFLSTAKQKGHIIGVVSNGVWRFQKITLSLTGLWDYLDFVVTSDLVNTIKPFPAIFGRGEEECQRRGCSEIYFFGDSLLFDVVGGVLYGYDRVYWLTDVDDCLVVKMLGDYRDKIEDEILNYGINIDIPEKVYSEEIYLYKDYSCLKKILFSESLE